MSLLSDANVPIEVISRLDRAPLHERNGNRHRKQLRPVIKGGAGVMDRIFPRETGPGA